MFGDYAPRTNRLTNVVAGRLCGSAPLCAGSLPVHLSRARSLIHRNKMADLPAPLRTAQAIGIISASFLSGTYSTGNIFHPFNSTN